MGKHSIEERLAAVQRYLNGEASTLIARQTGIDHHDIIVYAMRYQREGMAGLEDRLRQDKSKQEKLNAINEYLKESLTLEEIAVKHEVSVGCFKNWLRAYRRGDTESLRDKRFDSRIKTVMAKSQKDPSDMTKEELQDLVKDLAAENALLKKVKALVEKREAQKHVTGSKPSKN